MDGLQDGAAQVEQGAAQQQGSQDGGQASQASQATVTDAARGASGAGIDSGDVATKARAKYEATLAERDARIAELGDEIAEVAKTAEGAEMDELRRKGDEERVGFELQLAGARNVKAARALLADYDNDIDKLKAAEPWLFSAPASPVPAGATGLPNAGAATDEGAQMRRRRKIAGIDDEEE